jgi:hypothetical protein
MLDSRQDYGALPELKQLESELTKAASTEESAVFVLLTGNAICRNLKVKSPYRPAAVRK